MLLFIFSFSLVVMSCEKNQENEPGIINVTKVVVSPSEATMDIQEELQLSATIYPENATNKTITWTSSDSKIASVSELGLVKALSDGEVLITVKSEDGNFTSSCRILVKPIIVDIDYIDEYAINHGKGIKIADLTWAPVNCGYHADKFKFGKLYQWGRVDGLAYYDEFFADANDNSEKPIIAQSAIPYGQVPDKNTFYPGSFSETYGHWMAPSDEGYPAFDDETIWNSLKEIAVHAENSGVGNPCPEGWRVPTLEEFISLKLEKESLAEACRYDKENFGVWFGENRETATLDDTKGALFLSAAGGINRQGVALERNSTGEYWTATPDFEMATNLTFLPGSGNLMIDFPYQRAFALSVRCVR